MQKQITLDELTRRAEAGEPAAQYSLAAYLSGKGRREEANRWLTAAAAAGEPEALYTMATRRAHTRKGILSVAADLEEAATIGSPSASMLVAVLRATGVGFPQDDAAAVSLVLDWAKRGLAQPRRDLGALLLLQHPDDPDGSALLTGAEPADWAAVAGRLTLAPPPLVAPVRICDSPDVIHFRGVVPAAVCEYVISLTAPRLAPALVFEPGGKRLIRDQSRTSMAANFAPIDLQLAIVALNRTIAAAAGLSASHAEFLSVMRYKAGEQYRPHFDFLPPGPDFDRNGQRVKTALLYLNDNYEGGETEFVTPGLKVKGRTGDIVVFSNVLADGRGDPASRHAGLPVVSGEKWLASKWFRERNYDY